MELIWGVLGFLVFLIFLAVLVGMIVLPIVALVRTRRIAELSVRLDRVERQLHQVLLGGIAPAAERRQPATAPPAAEEPAEIMEVEPVEAVPEGPRDVGIRPPPRPARRRAISVPRLPMDTSGLEAWIGRRGLGWAAVVLLLFATAFFLKTAFENQWIGEVGRVAIGILAGAALCLAGLRFFQRGWPIFSQMLTSAGVILLYLATFAAFGFYHLLPQQHAAIFLVAIVAGAAALAVLYEAPAIALMAVIGGLLTPILMHTDRDQYRSLFAYLAVLDAGVVGLVHFRRWWAVGTVALVGSHGLFWLWYGQHYHPEKLAAALTFQVMIFALFVAYSVAAHVVRRRNAGIEDLARLVLNAFLFFGALYGLLNEQYHVWMGTLAVLMAIGYTTLAWLILRRRPEDQRQLLAVVATALAFVALAFPLQADTAWVLVGWAVEGLALWWFGLRVRAGALRGLATALLLLAVGLVLGLTPHAHNEPFVPIFNKYALPSLTVAACLLGVAAVSRRYNARLHDPDRVAMHGAGLGGVVLVWLIVTVETYTFFTNLSPYVYDSDLGLMARASLSVVWAAYAAVILAVGFRLHSSPLRWMALGLFGLTLAKVVIYDMAGLPGFYRVITFFVLSIMMAAAAWGYQKLKPPRSQAGQEVATHEAG